MKVQVIRPNIEKYRIRMERGDKDYTRCMWADILIDYDAYAITAQTDCGDYSYRWTATPGEESFRELCLRMLGHDEYLLGKFSEKTKFSLPESKLLFSNMNKDPEDRGLVEAVNGICASTAEEWIEELHDLDIDEPWVYIVNEYPQSAFTFVHLLKTIVLPTMRGATKA